MADYKRCYGNGGGYGPVVAYAKEEGENWKEATRKVQDQVTEWLTKRWSRHQEFYESLMEKGSLETFLQMGIIAKKSGRWHEEIREAAKQARQAAEERAAVKEMLDDLY